MVAGVSGKLHFHAQKLVVKEATPGQEHVTTQNLLLVAKTVKVTMLR